jgi:hypothetical protein
MGTSTKYNGRHNGIFSLLGGTKCYHAKSGRKITLLFSVILKSLPLHSKEYNINLLLILGRYKNSIK